MRHNYKLSFFVPRDHLNAVKTAVFTAGAGQQGDYEHCCWQTLGQGQFRPNEKASPYIGRSGELSQVEEYKVEVLCSAECIKAAITALKTAHPYEEPAYDVIELLDF
ncbi:YqfO family protein [uncultured Pseudoteredinibacter sp.]|uniref:Nif3-like dinuclear metal center hexameric protein n=1 Tax=uncultured Pseudoteredinibacter sp. TaxID=1641701 RepID=UPI0026191893|nr:YqfO family protein [uncultured Pseudoteredinibacter sp.]